MASFRDLVGDKMKALGMTVNQRDDLGHSLLMDYMTYRSKANREYLITNGADLNAVAPDGLTVLWTAITHDLNSETYLIDDLLARNLDIGVSEHQFKRRTPLQLAFDRRNHELCDTLLDASCSVRYMREHMKSVREEDLKDEEMQRVRRRILEMSAAPYSLQELARLVILRALGQGSLAEKLHQLQSIYPMPDICLDLLAKTLHFDLNLHCERLPDGL